MVEFQQDGRVLTVMLPNTDNVLIPVGEIDRNGFRPRSYRPILDPETLKAIATKAKEVKEFGLNPEPCSHCEGTPYFPLAVSCPSPRHLEFY